MEQKELLKTRQSLDHRRLEQGFLLYGAIEVVMKYKMKFDNIVLERNSLVEMVVEEYHKVFYDKWTGKESAILLNVMNCGKNTRQWHVFVSIYLPLSILAIKWLIFHFIFVRGVNTPAVSMILQYP